MSSRWDRMYLNNFTNNTKLGSVIDIPGGFPDIQKDLDRLEN